MKLVIDVDDKTYKMIKNSTFFIENDKAFVAIRDGKPLPQSATNGDMIKTIFPNLEWRDERGDTKSYILEPEHILSPKLIAFNSWWDAPYKALEQEPCEDAVSRQAILDIIEKEEFKGDALSEIEKLLPVNLQKIGHWIADVDKWGDIVTTVNGYRCDKCNTFNADKDNYCPNCGAKMVEPQERSDKE